MEISRNLSFLFYENLLKFSNSFIKLFLISIAKSKYNKYNREKLMKKGFENFYE